jgi:dipeptidyl aminopeptidase/acylaminoacyl peptidase
MLGAPFGRRTFLRRAGLSFLPVGAGLSLWPLRGFGDAPAPSAPELIPRRTFYENPEYRNVKISPDGKHLSYLAPVDGVRNLCVASIDATHDAKPLTHATDRDIGWEYRWAFTNRHIVFFRDHDGDENWRAASVDIEDGAIVPLSPETAVKSFIQESDSKFPEEMLLRHNQRDKHLFDLFRINVVTGKSELVFENHDYYELLTDSDFRLRLGGRVGDDGSFTWFERQEDGSWTPFMTVPLGDIDSTTLLHFSKDGNTLYAIDSRSRDKAAFVALEMTTRQATVLASDDEADIVRALFAHRRPLAAIAESARVRWHPVDPSFGTDLKALADYDTGDLYITGIDRPGKTMVAYFNHDARSGEYALIDRDSAVVKHLYVQHKALNEVKLRPLEPVKFPARDGLVLNGYLTRPAPPAGGGKPPLILVIHGGPYARDEWGFYPEHQWLANRGYAVLSINYRGSTGFGKALVTAADHEWGGKMHDDLIDGLDWALAQGIGEPDRTGFFGGSYGGYSALTAATKTPERFTCIVDLFGISNLITFMAAIPPYWTPWSRVWNERLGDPDTAAGKAFLADRSPLNHLERATKPILIAQGMMDVRVVPAESEQMVRALTQRGVPVTYVTFADEGHGFVRPENPLAFAAVAEAFFATHLGGRVQPVGNDFAGSSIRIATGRELVPGLPA